MTTDIAVFPFAVTNATPNLRNGAVTAMLPAARASAISPEYHSVAVALANGVSAEQSVEAYIRTCYGVFGATAVAAAAAVAPAPAPAAGQAAAYDANTFITSGDRRVDAIVLGAARASIIGSWHITDNDYIASERSTVHLFTVNSATVGTVTTISIVANTAAAVNPDQTAIGVGMAKLSADEWEFAYFIYTMARAAPVLAGCELLESGHHYLSTKTKATEAVERQFLNLLTPNSVAMQMWTANTARIRDLLWHKAAHPVLTTVLSSFAIDPVVKTRLIAVGMGSAVVRLPFSESLVRSAQAIVALHDQVKGSISAAGHSVQIPTLRAAMAVIKASNGTTVGAYTIPPHAAVTDRNAFVVQVLAPIIHDTEPVAAWCIGWYRCTLEASDIVTRQDSLLNSYTAKRVAKTYAIMNSEGDTYCKLWAKAQKKQVEQGSLATITLSV